MVQLNKSTRIQRIEHQFRTCEESKAERDAKADLLPRYAEKARKQEQEKNKAELHDADRALQSSKGVHQRILVKRVRKGDHYRNQQHHHSRPLEQQRTQVFQRVIGAEHVEENLMNDFKAENRVDRLAQPEKNEIHLE